MANPRSSSGMTMTELMAAVLIVSFIAIGLGALMTTTFTSQARNLSRNQVRMEMMLAAGRLNRDLYESHAIITPAPGAEADVLEGYINRVYVGAGAATPWLNASTLDQNGTYTRFYYCLDGTGQWLYRSDSLAIAAEPAGVAPGDCGKGAGWEILVRTPRRAAGRTAGNRMFSRAGGSREHLVEIAADISDPSAKQNLTFPLRLSLASRKPAVSPP